MQEQIVVLCHRRLLVEAEVVGTAVVMHRTGKILDLVVEKSGVVGRSLCLLLSRVVVGSHVSCRFLGAVGMLDEPCQWCGK